MSGTDWSVPVAWPRPTEGARSLRLEADAPARAAVARRLDLPGVERLQADLVLRPWMDGVEIEGRLQAQVTRTCGITLEPLEERIDEPVRARYLPPGSAGLPVETAEAHVELDAEDPPEPGSAAGVDLGELLVELLSVSLEPFPRLPGATFNPPPQTEEISPFAALAALRKPPAQS